jgi:predicted TIM-barrel fold metal-dependent hydrolase
MRIDCHAHAAPVEYTAALKEQAGSKFRRQSLWNEKERLESMDQGQIDKQVLTFPAQRLYARPEPSVTLARVLNDGIAAICRKHPDRFIGFCTLPLQRGAEALAELERAVHELGLRGVTVLSNVAGRTLDEPEFQETFAKIDEMKLPVFIHPAERNDFPQAWRFFELDHYIGWPVDTAFCLGKMICSGMLDRCQNITWLVSHMGGPIHTLLARIDRARHQSSAQKPPAEYLKSFYYDTAGPSHPGAVMGAVYTVGIDHILFGTDLPFGEDGDYVERALECIEGADLSPEQKDLIYPGNAAKIFQL